MKAVVCEELGRVELRELPDPEPGAGQVVIQVEAAGVNYVDGLIVAGRYQLRPPLPFTPGSEVAGRLDDDTRVMAFCMFGGFATHVAINRDQAVRIPDHLSAEKAAGFIQSYCTAAYALKRRARMEPGERVLVLGAGGGVGLAAIQLAKAYGGQVLAAASTPGKRELAERAGADETVGYEELKQAARSFGVDITVDPVGGELSEQALRGMREGGRLLVIGFAAGPIPDLPANQVLLRNRSVVGVDWGAWAITRQAENRVLLEELLQLDGLDPVTPEARSLAEAGQAMDDLVSRRITGKLVLVPSSRR